MHEVKLPALDGSNLLAFMAALGTVRLLSLQNAVTLKWIKEDLAWIPVVVSNLAQGKIMETLFSASDAMLDGCQQAIIKKCHARIAKLRTFNQKLETNHNAATKKTLKTALGKRIKKVTKCTEKIEALTARQRGYAWLAEFEDLKLPAETFRDYNSRGQASSSRTGRMWSDFATAFASEAILKKETIDYTAFCALGGGQSRFIKSLLNLCLEATSVDINEALFSGWKYDKQCSSLRWDGIEHRRYALRANDPASDQKYKVPGANRLAFEALPLFPCMPVGSRLQTTGFSRFEKAVTITWPIWTDTLGMDEIRTLLASPSLQKESPDRNTLSAMGIHQIYRSRRISEGKYRNFTPSTALL